MNNNHFASKGNSLAALKPDLEKEWDYEKNDESGLIPLNVKAHSGKKAWWKCPKGHSYESVIASRSSGTACPYCSNIKVSIEKSLWKLNQRLSKEWDYERNGEITPKDVTPGSKKMVNWKCRKNEKHRWRARIYSRNRGRGCPYCAHQKVSEENCLAAVNPTLASEWHPIKNEKLTPWDVLPGIEDEVWWKCKKCGYEYSATINHRNGGTGCPACSGRVASERNSIASVRPDLAMEWHPTKNGNLTPDNVSVFSDKKVWWFCANNHELEYSVNQRSGMLGCPMCTHQIASPEYNLSTKNPELAAEWHPSKNASRKPENYLPYSNEKVWWLCPRKHSYESTIANRNNGNGCPQCHPSISRNEVRILTEMRSIFLEARKANKYGKEIDIFLPEINAGIEYDGYFFHKGKIRNDREKNVVLKRNGITLFRVREMKLPKISSFDIVPEKGELKINDIINLLKVIEHQLDLPEKYRLLISDYIKDGIFKNDEEYYSILKNIKLPPREKSLAYLYPKIAAQLHPKLNNGINADLIYAHSGIKYFWQCGIVRKHVWPATPDHRSRGTSCPMCAGRKMKPKILNR